MGKKSQFYDAYKQSKCVLEEVLSKLPRKHGRANRRELEITGDYLIKAYRVA